MAINWDAPIEIRDFRNGEWFWIQKSVWQDKKLSASDKIIYGTIAFFANQKSQTAWPALITIASFSDISTRQTYRSLKQLERLLYIKIIRGGGRGKPNQYQLLKIKGDIVAEFNNTTPYLAENSAKKTGTNNTANNININNKNNNTLVLRTNGDFGNPQINEGIKLLTDFFGYPPQQIKKNRYSLNSLIKSKGYDRTIKAMKFALSQQDRSFCPVITSYMALQRKWADLEVYARREIIGSRKGGVIDATNI